MRLQFTRGTVEVDLKWSPIGAALLFEEEHFPAGGKCTSLNLIEVDTTCNLFPVHVAAIPIRCFVTALVRASRLEAEMQNPDKMPGGVVNPQGYFPLGWPVDMESTFPG